MNEQISFMDIFRMILKRWWILLSIVCVCGIISFTICEYFITPMYTSSGKLFARIDTNDAEANANITNINTATRLVSTYIEIFKTDTFLGRIADVSGLDYTAKQISNMISLSSLSETEILSVEVTCPSPTDAKILANLIMDSAQDEIDRIGHGGYVSVIDEATTPQAPSSPNVELYIIIGVLLGVLIGVGVILIIELLDTRIKGEDDLVSRYELPILGVIPTVEPINTKGGTV